MKKYLLTIFLSLLIPFVAVAQEAYAVYTSDGTLTFYYDKQKSSRSGTKYALNTASYTTPGWYDDHRTDIKKVVFTSSFSNARPTNTKWWFAIQYNDSKSNLSEIEGIEYLNTSKVTDMYRMFFGCSSLTNLDVSHFDTKNVTELSAMFYGCSSLTNLDVSNFNTSKATRMRDMFEGCSSLTKLDVSHFDTRNVTDMSYMFYKCSSLTSLDISGFDTKNVKDMKWMFSDCRSLTHLDVSHFNTGNVTDMSLMFNNCSSLKSLDVSNFNTSNVTDMNAMFYDCRNVSTLDVSRFDTSNVTNMKTMFYMCSSLTILDVSNFSTKKVTNMTSMFYICSGLSSLDVSHFDTSNVTDMSYMFLDCSGLKDLNLANFITNKVVRMRETFYGCSGLTKLDLSFFETSNVTDMTLMFKGCQNLKTIYVGEGWNTNKVTSSSDMFRNCASLVGGAGTKYDANYVDKEYAHIDGGTSNPGYLTDKNATSQTDEAYAVYTDDGTLTFYYDNQKSSRSGTKYELNTSTPGWRTDHANDIKKAVFNSSFANARPTSTGAWFAAIGFRSILTEIVGMQYLNTSNVTSMRYMFYGCDKIATLDVSNFNTTNVTDMSSMFYGCRGLTSLDVSHFDTNKVTDMNGMFFGCSSLTSLNTSKFNTGNVTDMKKMFEDCNGLTSLDVSHFDTSKVTDMGNMFRLCSGLTNLDVSHFDTSKVTEMSGIFQDCGGLTNLDVSNFDTSNVTRMVYMFLGCSGLTSLDVSHFNTSKVTDMSGMFERCSGLTSLDVSHFDTSKVTNMGYMFWDCIGLTSLDVSNFNTINVTNMRYMFCGCSGLTSLDVSHFDTSKVTDMGNMFRLCSGLTSLDVSNFDTNKIMDMQGLFFGCSGLTSLDLSSFNTSNVTYMNERGHDENNFEEVNGMFEDCINLKTIYVGEGWTTDKVTYSKVMFANCTNLVGGKGTKYDANHVDKEYAHIDGGTSNPGYLTDKNATSSMNLQEFIDSKAGETSVVEVDLSKFENDLTREQTLNVSTGASYRFTNGTLSRSEALDAPVVYVSNGSKMEVGNGAIITSQGHLAADPQALFKVEATIKLDNGSLYITSGKVEGSCGGRNHGNEMVTTIDEEDPAVELTSDNDTFLMTGGEMGGYFLCTAEEANVRFMGGEIYGHYYKKSTAAQGAPQTNRATAFYDYAPLIDTRSNVYINKVKSYWGHRGWYFGNEDQNDFSVSLHGNNVVYLQSGGMDSFGFTVEDKKDGDLVMVGDNYTITASDMACMSVRPFSYYSESLGHYVEQECYLELKDNKVYLRYKKDEVCDADDIQRFIKDREGTADMTLCDEPTIDEDVDVDDIQIFIDGTGRESQPVIGFYGGTFNIRQNAGMSFKSVTFASKGTNAISRRADGNGGINNAGTLSFQDCTFLDGSYSIVNSKDTYIDGTVTGLRLTNKYGGHVYVTSPLTKDVQVSIESAADVEEGTPVMLGGDGYTLTEADAEHIDLALPQGYEWKYDNTTNSIIVSVASGISQAAREQPTVVESFDVTGHKADTNTKGLKIQRMSDGTVRKTFIHPLNKQ